MIRNIFKLLRNYIYMVIIALMNRRCKTKKYYVSICGIFKNEAKYLREWIEFHRIVGVEHFYLYNNFSSDNYMEILQPYIDSKVVTLIDWPHQKGQALAYNHCLQNFKDQTSWLGFIDLDEFVVPNKYDNVSEWLKKHEKQPMAFVYWKFFASGGNVTENNKALVSETYTLSSCFSGTQKMFFNTSWGDWVKKIRIAHIVKLKYLGTYVPNDPMLFYGFLKNKKENDIQLNHYYNKSYEYQLRKKIPNGNVLENVEYTFDAFYKKEKVCRFPDYNIYSYLVKLKLALAKYKS